MSFLFDPPRGKAPEQEMVFEEVGEDEAEDFTYKEDPVETMVANILGLEKQVADAKKKSATSREGKRELTVSEVLLAKARVEQAIQNERNGRGKEGAVDRLLDELEAAEEKLDTLNDSQMTDARSAALKRFDRGSQDLDADTLKQLRRHAA